MALVELWELDKFSVEITNRHKRSHWFQKK